MIWRSGAKNIHYVTEIIRTEKDKRHRCANMILVLFRRLENFSYYALTPAVQNTLCQGQWQCRDQGQCVHMNCVKTPCILYVIKVLLINPPCLAVESCGYVLKILSAWDNILSTANKEPHAETRCGRSDRGFTQVQTKHV